MILKIHNNDNKTEYTFYALLKSSLKINRRIKARLSMPAIGNSDTTGVRH